MNQMTKHLSMHEAFQTSSPWWGWMPSPAALVLYVCPYCACRSERRVCELCEEDLQRKNDPSGTH